MIRNRTLRTLISAVVIGFGLGAFIPDAPLAKNSDTFSDPALSARLITVQDAVAKDAVTITAGLDLVLVRAGRPIGDHRERLVFLRKSTGTDR